MLGSKMGLIIAALIGLLSVSNTQGFGCKETKNFYYAMNKYDCTYFMHISEEAFSTVGNYLELRDILDVPQLIADLLTFDKKYAITEVILADSNINTFPSDLLSLDNVESLEVIGNDIPSINLNILPYAKKKLFKLNVSHNGIKEFEIEPTTYKSTKYLQSIDLSFNLIDHVPLNCFYSTRDSLQYLDLSHNQITSFDFYAFSSLVLLKSLRLSHNKLVQLDLFLYPLRNLRTLYLDHNQVKAINSEVFDKSQKLTILDLSYNNIEKIEDQTFAVLTDLSSLNISNNDITSIKEILFRSNTRLESFDISFNNLSYIEPGTFSTLENLVSIDLERAFAMPILEHMLTGVKVNRLNFAGSTINKVEARSFISLGHHLLYLNLSSSAIQEISETALDTLTNLTELDLSNNNLSEIAFQTADLENLSKLYLCNNSIRELKPESFQHLLSLTELDLSNNDIRTIPPMTFRNLKNLKSFKIHNNDLESMLLPNAFFGLENIEHLELINTNVIRWESYALTGMKNLKVLNASHGQLSYVDYYAFTGTGNIEILDLSHNQIHHFNIKLMPNKNMKEIYLNNNQLGSLIKNAFAGFDNLIILNLSNNNMVTIDSSAFSSLKSMRHLDLSHNFDLKLGGDVFDNLVLDTVLLRGINNQITFEPGMVTIENLDISASNITNVSLLHVHNIRGLTKLNLSQNNITVLDQFSFADFMQTLISLNLSNNNLVHINPGTFLKTKSIRYIDLSHNKLERIQFGALYGLEGLETLDLSNNVLSNFKLTLLFNLPSVSTIVLENNEIYSLGISEKVYALKKLVVGGNRLSCDDLIDLKMLSKITITAGTLDYFTENVDGIACNYYPLANEDIMPRFGME